MNSNFLLGEGSSRRYACGTERRVNVISHPDRTTLALSIRRNLKLFLGMEPREATADDMYLAVAFTVRELALEGLMATREKVKE